MIVPVLAPLIGKMTTHSVDERWTAEEALTFFDELQARLPADVLDLGVSLAWDVDPMDDPGLYWDRLSPEFQSSWKSHRPPPLSRITSSPVGEYYRNWLGDCPGRPPLSVHLVA